MPRGSLPDTLGFLSGDVIANPGLQTPLTLGIIGNQRYRFIAAKALFTTDATVATRQVYFEILSGVNSLYKQYANITQLASLARTYYFGIGLRDENTFINNILSTPIGDQLYFNDALTAQLNVDNMQGGDQFTACTQLIEYFVEE